ncbi:uncharacterized protein LOC108628204 [Ceratina calcarata]|uniref:Uncharacterized protein LOC108628204 n=1 Tax=Ceratina calcarata TaxID=156304 RepID=A0AAJ7NAB4_9HYME|nr:uncharacterized protein LOC108628204 [Ceratina calcarata]
MSTPILTKHQQRHSLSAKKGTVKGLRNVLAQPQDNYWPVVDAEKCSLLEGLLNKLMPAIKRPTSLIPWSQLEHMKKEERAKAKKDALKEENVPNTEIAGSIILGINAITRSLEKNNVCCVLMDANIEPQLLVKHIIHMAQNKNVPILLLPKLKIVTLNTIGYASAACALKNFVMDSVDHHFHPLYLTICDIFKEIPLSRNRLQLFKDIDATQEIVLSEEDKMSIESETDSSKPTKFTLSTDVYVYRSSCEERVFVPPSVTESKTKEPVTEEVKQDDFISLGSYDFEYDESMEKKKRYVNIHEDKNSKRKRKNGDDNTIDVKYLPLKVKRTQGNVNRVKGTKVSKQKKK